MPRRIEDYALIGDMQSAALVGRDGSIDWLCFPRFDSPSCFAALLGDRSHGRWLLGPAAEVRSTRRRYRPGTLVLETEHETDAGSVRVIDFMPPRGHTPDLVRVVETVGNHSVPMRMELVLRFDYGRTVPWVRRHGDALLAIAGPNAICLRTPIATHGEGLSTVADFTVQPGRPVPFVMTWYPSHERPPRALDGCLEVLETERWWRSWSDRATYDGAWRDAVLGSIVVLKALTFTPTGGLVAAPTSSLPEELGGSRNWDYRYCWLRDATLTLLSMMLGGYRQEAEAWRDWLLRAVAGDVTEMQTLYGLGGERVIEERELPWLPGFDGARPVRVGNAAVNQFQLDVFGEVMDALFQARRMGIPPDPWSWALQRKLLDVLQRRWREPDEGIWEIRGARRHFTHSKVMSWVAFDRAVKTIERFADPCSERPDVVDRWRALRDEIHADVCAHAFDASRGAFTQAYGSRELDATALLMPALGFIAPDDPRFLGTMRAIERELVRDGFVERYSRERSSAIDGVPGRDGAFVACSFWLADAYAMTGRTRDAHALFERLLALRNDVGLLSEEVDPGSGQMLGNFPQAFSHLALVSTARNLCSTEPGPAAERRA